MPSSFVARHSPSIAFAFATLSAMSTFDVECVPSQETPKKPV